MTHFVMLLILLAFQQSAPSSGASVEPLVHEGTVAAPVEQVWAAFSTEAGIKSWMAPHATVDLRVGGKIQTNYNPDGVIGDAGTIENTIISYEPLRMLSIKATKPPESFPFKNAIRAMWTVVHFDSAGPAQTKLRIVGMGFTDDPESQQLRAFFDRGNAYTLKRLQEKFAAQSSRPATEKSAPGEADQVLAHLAKFVGGEWISETKRPDGGVFRVRNHMMFGPDGKSIVTRGWLGNAEGMSEHSAAQIWRDVNEDGSLAIRFQNVDETGAVARGEIRMLDPQTSEWDWKSTNLGGAVSQFRINMRFETADSYQLRIFVLPAADSAAHDAAPREMVNAKFQRVADVPAEFQKMRHSAK